MKTNFQTLEIFNNGPLVILKLSRPEKRNALNPLMIAELQEVFAELALNSEAVILNLVGKGQSFCAGADLNWIQSMSQYSEEKINAEFSELGKMLSMLYHLPQITISMVHGTVYGGGIGLFSACDYVMSAPETTFSFSEIKLGLVPATIAPYAIQRIGPSKAKKLFLTGERFDENYATSISLVDEVVKADTQALNYQTLTELLLTQPRPAIRSMKNLFRMVEQGTISSEKFSEASKLIASLIKSKESQNLLSKFFGKD